MKQLKALYNAVIVKPVESDESLYGSIIVPDLGNEKNTLGEVVSVGEGHYSVTGVWINTVVKVGDIVVLPTMGFTKLEHNGTEYYIGPENQVLGKIVDEEEIIDDLPF